MSSIQLIFVILYDHHKCHKMTSYSIYESYKMSYDNINVWQYGYQNNRKLKVPADFYLGYLFFLLYPAYLRPTFTKILLKGNKQIIQKINELSKILAKNAFIYLSHVVSNYSLNLHIRKLKIISVS